MIISRKTLHGIILWQSLELEVDDRLDEDDGGE